MGTAIIAKQNGQKQDENLLGVISNTYFEEKVGFRKTHGKKKCKEKGELYKMDILSELIQQGQAIGRAAQAGDEKAKRVIELYTLWYNCPSDQAAQALLEVAYKEYKEAEIR